MARTPGARIVSRGLGSYASNGSVSARYIIDMIAAAPTWAKKVGAAVGRKNRIS
jgi:hypothetical protein